MKKLFAVLSTALLACTVNSAHAETAIDRFMMKKSATGYFHCAYRGKVASKKCKVRLTTGNSSQSRYLTRFLGPNEEVPLLLIYWPDGDVSRYMSVTQGYQYVNLDNDENYELRTWPIREGWMESTFGNELIIQDVMTGRERVKLWY